MLRFRLGQLHVPSLDKYFLPLPKLTPAQLALISSGLEKRGFSVQAGARTGRRVASKGTLRITLDGWLGLATSGQDLLDAIAPEIPALLSSCKPGDSDLSGNYFVMKRSDSRVELQLFPRLESLRSWTCLRRDGLSGLTQDEAAVLKTVLGRAPASAPMRCVTETPRRGSKPLQAGRRVYYESSVTIRDFLSGLRTIDNVGFNYLPRNSLIELAQEPRDTRVSAKDLGEWCCRG